MALKDIEALGPQGRAKRGQILAAARQLFLAHGFERTSMEAIREASGVSKPTLYTHYQGKEALFADVITELVEQIAGEWLPSSGKQPTFQSVAELQAILTMLAHRAATSFMRPEYLAVVRVVVTETPRLPQLGDIFRTIGAEQGLTTIASLLERANASGLIAVANPQAAARMFVGSIISYALTDGLLVGGPPRVPSREQIDAVVALFMRAIT